MCVRFGIALGLISLLPAVVSANGLDIPEQGARSLARGGAFSARADDPTATVHNPGAVSKLRGTHIMYSHNLFWNFTDFTRGESTVPPTVGTDMLSGHETRFQKVSNETPFFPLNATVAATSDFGLDNMAFGLSILGPNSSGKVTYPQDGGQRYMLTELDVLLIYYGFTAAYGTDRWGIGATLQWVHLPYLDFSLVVDGTILPTVNPYASSFDIEATVHVEDKFAPSALLGAWFRPIDSIEIGLSGRPFRINLDTKGNPEITKITGTIPDSLMLDLAVKNGSTSLDLTLPPTARLGARYRHLSGQTEVFDIEVDVVWEGWSTLLQYDAKLKGGVEIFGTDRALNDVVVKKSWQDVLSVRLGGSWQVLPGQLSLSMGGFWEQAAAPDSHAHLDFPAGERLGLGSGLTYTFTLSPSTSLDLTVAYNYTSQKDITVSEAEGRVYQQRPLSPCNQESNCDDASGIVANAGTFQSVFQQIGLAAGLKF
jgi:long-subunit fatty acid transport protein